MLQLHRSERAGPLAEALAEILAAPIGDPFAAELVAVPTRGMERWLSQRLSGRLGARPGGGDGICANVLFPPPGAVVGEALGVAGGVASDADPWPAPRSVWPLIEVAEACLDEPWLGPLAAHLTAGRARRFARILGVARLFEEYGIRRPAMIREWAAGDFDPDGPGGWQPQLWRELRARLGVPSPAERLQGACERLRLEPGLVELPDRLSVFGLTRMPSSYLEVLSALAVHREVHLLLLHPSPALWEAVSSDPSARARSRLLASWGREVRELQTVLGGRADGDVHHSAPAATEPPSTLLAAIQADIRADRQPPGAPLGDATDERIVLGADDTSIQVHSCHGRARQVQVLHEAILHRLADAPDLEPRDVIVMCPDVETFAPLIEATFGALELVGDADPGQGGSSPSGSGQGGPDSGPPELRVRLADRSLRQTNPVLGVVARLLELADGRITASEVIDLADRAPVRARFGFDDDDLAQIREWVADAGVHWGLDAEHRSGYRLGEVDAGTWAFGLRRLLLGVTMSESEQALFERVLPLEDVPSGRIELAGRLAELIDRLGWAVRSLQGAQTVAGWSQTLSAAVEMLSLSPERDAWQRRELDRMLEEVAADAEHSGSSPELALPEIRALLADRLRGRPTRANFHTGQLTVCTLMPMRSVPHRIVCLLGLDDGAFPRHAAHDGDNLLLEHPEPGDRNPRTEDRQLLLDALMAAQDALIITYTGNDERTGASRPPAVPVGELLDAVDATARWAGPGEGSEGSEEGPERPARERVRVAHPLQSFDPANFAAGAISGAAPWSFDPAALAGAIAFAAPRTEPPPFLTEPLDALGEPLALGLRDLIAFVEHPIRAFLRQRLGVGTFAAEDELQDALPVELRGLAGWEVGQRLLDGVLAGHDPRTLGLSEIARGSLPPGDLGRPALQDVWKRVDALHRAAVAGGADREPGSVETNLTLPDGTRLTGTVSGVREHLAMTVGYSRLAARHRLGAWVRLLALSAAHPDVPYEAVTIGRSSDPEWDVTVARVPMLAGTAGLRADFARSQLQALCALYREGMRAPLALPSETTAAYAAALRSGAGAEDAAEAARMEWTSGWQGRSWHYGEDDDPEYQRAFGAGLRLDALAAHAPTLWAALLDRETVEWL